MMGSATIARLEDWLPVSNRDDAVTFNRRRSEPPADLIPIAEAASLVERAPKTVRHWIKDKRIKAWRRLGRLFVSREEVELAVAYQPVEPT